MIAHVTAAALASENKSHAHPASVDSIPTSANQEDHVSMATYAGRRLYDMACNTATIVGIELLAAAQGVDFHLEEGLHTSPKLASVHQTLRQSVAHYDKDRYFAPDIENAKQLVIDGKLIDSWRELRTDWFFGKIASMCVCHVVMSVFFFIKGNDSMSFYERTIQAL